MYGAGTLTPIKYSQVDSGQYTPTVQILLAYSKSVSSLGTGDPTPPPIEFYTKICASSHNHHITINKYRKQSIFEAIHTSALATSYPPCLTTFLLVQIASTKPSIFSTPIGSLMQLLKSYALPVYHVSLVPSRIGVSVYKFIALRDPCLILNLLVALVESPLLQRTGY